MGTAREKLAQMSNIVERYLLHRIIFFKHWQTTAIHLFNVHQLVIVFHNLRYG